MSFENSSTSKELPSSSPSNTINSQVHADSYSDVPAVIFQTISCVCLNRHLWCALGKWWLVVWFCVCDGVLEMYCLCSLPCAAGGLLCGRGFRGSLNVTCLVVFLKPPGGGGVGTLRESTWDYATMFGTLNSKIPSLSNVV